MKAIGYNQAGPISAPDALIEFETETPELRPHDLLVEVRGISVNPVDVKIRKNMPPEHGTKVLGYDAAGVVQKVGSEVSNFLVGDEVFYAGDFTRPGTNSELHAVDERIVGKKPQLLDFVHAAGLPLTSITAWELLFESLGVQQGKGQGESLLIIGGAGGVGSILIQLKDLNLQPRYVASLTGTDGHFPAIIELIKPRGHVAFIDDPETLDIKSGKLKALSFSWEFMFARSMFQTDDIDYQHQLLTRVSEMIDDGTLTSTVTNHLGTISVATLTAAHEQQESGRAIGKNVLDGFH